MFDPEGFYITTLADSFGPKSVAVDSEGNLYVFEQTVGSPSEVARYEPTVYEPEAGKIAYSTTRVVVAATNTINNGGLAIDASNDHLFIAEGGSISEYGAAAEVSAVEGNKLLDTVSPPGLSATVWVAVDAQRRRLFASDCKNQSFECGVLVYNADGDHELVAEIYGPGSEEEFVSSKGWLSIAVNEETGHFFIDDLEQLPKSVFEFDENYEPVSELTLSGFQGGQPLQIAVSNSSLQEEAVNRHFLFVPVVKKLAGQVLAFEPFVEPPAPQIVEVSVSGIGETEAELQAKIDPNGSDTDYFFEYATQEAYEAEGFASATLAGKGAIPGVNLATSVQTFANGLAPGVSYRLRVRAENQAGEAETGEAAFTTYADAPADTGPCPNEGLRTGLSAILPDCRAYELVTPPDTNGHSPEGVGTSGDSFLTLSSSPGGGMISFLLDGGVLPETEGTGGFNGDPYRATRTASGWSSAAAGPTGVEASAVRAGGVSPDQGYSFYEADVKGSAVIEGDDTHYVRYPDGHSELIGRGSLETDPRAKGVLITKNGTHIVFRTQQLGIFIARQLEPNAPPTGIPALYDRTPDEVTHVVSLLPGEVTPKSSASYVGASNDGAGIAFSIDGNLYLRKDNAVTYEIGTGVTFAGVSEGGERIFYVEGGDLLAFDTASEEVVSFSETGDVTPVNVAPDGTRAYFVSPSVLGEENPNGAIAQAGEENLYLSEEGQISFVGTVTALDVEGKPKPGIPNVNGLGLWTISLAGGSWSATLPASLRTARCSCSSRRPSLTAGRPAVSRRSTASTAL